MNENICILYTRYYKPRLVYCLPHYSLLLILQAIHVLKEKILQILGLKSAVYNRERFQIKSGLLVRGSSRAGSSQSSS